MKARLRNASTGLEHVSDSLDEFAYDALSAVREEVASLEQRAAELSGEIVGLRQSIDRKLFLLAKVREPSADRRSRPARAEAGDEGESVDAQVFADEVRSALGKAAP